MSRVAGRANCLGWAGLITSQKQGQATDGVPAEWMIGAGVRGWELSVERWMKRWKRRAEGGRVEVEVFPRSSVPVGTWELVYAGSRVGRRGNSPRGNHDGEGEGEGEARRDKASGAMR